MPRLEVRDADITTLAVDAVANAANTELLHGGGVAARIEAEEAHRHLVAGSTLERVVFAVHGERARAAFQDAVDAVALAPDARQEP